jgi:hypothetical protein
LYTNDIRFVLFNLDYNAAWDCFKLSDEILMKFILGSVGLLVVNVDWWVGLVVLAGGVVDYLEGALVYELLGLEVSDAGPAELD